MADRPMADKERWRTSSRCVTNNHCVEVSFDDRVKVRDSKDPDPILTFDARSWQRFVTWRCS